MACVAMTVMWEGRMESELAPTSWETEHTPGHQPLVKGRGITVPLSCDLPPPPVSFLSGNLPPPHPSFCPGDFTSAPGAVWADGQASLCQDRSLGHGDLDPSSLEKGTEAQRGVDTHMCTHTNSRSPLTLEQQSRASGLSHLMSEPTGDSLTSQGRRKGVGGGASLYLCPT